MELQDSIKDKDGVFCPLHNIIRTSCIIKKMQNKKKITAKEIQYAVLMFFGDNKCKEAMNQGVTLLTTEIVKETPINIKKEKTIIRNIAKQYSINIIGDGAVYYCMGIYKDIDKYEQNTITFSKNHDIQDFLYLTELVMKCSQKLILRKVHFDCVKEILSPDEELDFNWTIDKSKEGVKNCIDAKFSNEFLNELKI